MSRVFRALRIAKHLVLGSLLDKRNLFLPRATSDKDHKPTSLRRTRILFESPHAVELIIDVRVRLSQLRANRRAERGKRALSAEFLENPDERMEGNRRE